VNCIVSSATPRRRGTRLTATPLSATRTGGLAACLAAILIASSGVAADAATFFVDGPNPSCVNSTSSGTEALPYCTITAALNGHAVGGNTIMVKPGIYHEQVSVPASGLSGSPIVLQGTAAGVVVDGSDDYTTTAQWTLFSGNVWLASAVTWDPRQVFLDGARTDSSVVAPASLPARSYRWVSGAGLYVNAGGGNPGTHQARVGRRNYGFTLPARSFITIDRFEITRTEDRGVFLSGNCTNVTVTHNTITYTNKMGIQAVGGSAIVIGSNTVGNCNDHGIAFITGVTGSTIEDNESFRNARPIDRVANGIYLFGCPSNTIRRNRVHDNEDSGFQIQSGSNGCISYLNRSYSNGDHGFDHLTATGTIHVCDVAYGNFRDGFSIEGNSTGTQVHDCIGVNNGLTTTEVDLWVDLGSTTGFVSNYNLFWNSTAQAPVKYITTMYATVSAYSAVSGQDAQTIQADPRFVNAAAGDFHLLTGSPAIDNGNSGAPNWPSLDADGLARFDASGVANTGIGPVAFSDRGAFEFRSTVANQAPNGTISTPTGNVTIIAGQSVNFTGTGTDPDNNLPLTYLWNFGGGAVNSTVQNPGNVVFTTAGTYTVAFTVTDALGLADATPATRTVTVTANAAPNGTISAPSGNVTITAGQSVSFAGSGTDSNNNLPLTYLWDFGGGATNSTLQNPGAVVFAIAGTYTVSFTVTDAIGLPDPTPATRVITVNPGANQAPNGTISAPAAAVTITAGQSVSFAGAGTDPNNNLPLTYLWNFGGGAANSTLQNPGAVVFATAGTFTVSFTVTDALGLPDPTPDTRVITVNANVAPNGVINTPAGAVTITAGQSVNFTGTGSDANSNLPLTYLWNFGGGAVNSTVQNPGNVVFAAPGVYTVTFTVTDALGLADPTPDSRVITVTGVNQAPNGTISAPAAAVTITAGQSVSFAGAGTDPDNNLPLTYLWNFGGGAANSTLQNPGAVVFATAGTYTVSFTVTDGLGLADPTPDTRVITVNANVAPNGVINTPAGAVTIAAGQSVNFTGTGSDPNSNLPLTYLWNFGGGAVNSTVQNPGNVVFTAPGTYTVTFTVTDALGLADPTPDSRVITVTGVNQAPNGTISAPAAAVTITVGQSVSFAGAGSDPDNNLPLTYLWNFGGGATNSTLQNPGAVVFATAGTYTVSFTVTDALGLADPTPDTRVITVNANVAPNGVINTPAGAVTITAGQSVNFTGTGSDANSNLPLTYLWNFGGGAANSTLQNPGVVVFATAGTYTVSFTVTDGLGLADPTPDTRVITVNSPTGGCTNLVSNPSFETDLLGWKGTGCTLAQVPGGSAGSFACRATGAATTSSFYAEGSTTWISPVAAGARYHFAASVRSDLGGGRVEIKILEYLNGIRVGTMDSPTVTLSATWQRLEVDYTAAQSGSKIYLTVKDVPAAVSEAFDLDDVSICAQGQTPPAPHAALVVTPSAGPAPLGVVADASGSTETGAGSIASYRFDFGDGTIVGPQPGATAPHTYAAGSWTCAVTVTDNLGSTSTASAIVLAGSPTGGPCSANLVGNPSFETDLIGWSGSGCTLERVAGGEAGSFSCRATGPAALSSFFAEGSTAWFPSVAAGARFHMSAWVRSDLGRGSAKIKILEYLNGIRVGTIDSPAVTLSASWQRLEVDYTAVQSGSKIYFTVKDNPVAISEVFDFDDASACPLAAAPVAAAAASRIEGESGAEAFFAPSVAPNPLGRQGVLRFSTRRAGPLRVTLFDVTGRRVHTLLEDPNAAAGLHILPLDERAGLGSGIYFYSIHSADGMKSGRFLIMK
jgi:PKD repeat protein